MGTRGAVAAAAPAAPRVFRSDARRNRDAVVDALLALYRDGNLAPSSAEVAERAGISPRSLFRYFADIDDLCRAAVERHQAAVAPLLALADAPGAPLAQRIEALVEQRGQLFDAIGAVGAVSRLRAPFQPIIAGELTRGRSYLRHQVRRLFAPELAALGPERGPAALAAIDVLCSYESYQLLRHDHSLSRPRTAAALTAALDALLREAP
jgi:TetR/AcrR family transcriptional regulator, regulator of autoinduction and epiphytic fitness